MLVVTFVHPQLFALIAFLMRQIASIEHSAIYILYDSQSTLESDCIAKALNSQLHTYKTIRNYGPVQHNREALRHHQFPRIFQDEALVISLVDEPQIVQMFGKKTDLYYYYSVQDQMTLKFICLITNGFVKRRVEPLFNVIHVMVRNDGRLEFLTWQTFWHNKHFYLRSLYVSKELDLVNSTEWHKFSNRVDHRSLKGIKVLPYMY